MILTNLINNKGEANAVALAALQSDDAFDQLKGGYEKINHIAYPKYPMDFLSRIKRVVWRFSNRGSNRDIAWMNAFAKTTLLITE